MASAVPLLALRVFVEVCRFGSMKDAAESMHVTAGAISHHIKSLEEILGAKLFVRRKGMLELTPVSSHLFEFTARSFEQIDHNFALLTGDQRRFQRPGDKDQRERLTVTTSEAFAAGWLIPRIGSFLKANSDIDLRVECNNEIVNMKSETRIDLALRHGQGHYEGLHCRLIFAPQLIPVMSPHLLEGRALACIGELTSIPLLHGLNRCDWQLWLEVHGAEPRIASGGSTFEGDAMLVQAAVAGHGVALVEDLYAEHELNSGRLIKAIDLSIDKAAGYYLVARPASLRKESVRRFVSWIDAITSQSRDNASDLGRRDLVQAPRIAAAAWHSAL